MKISELKKNPLNPRLISEASFKKLQRSLSDFPDMMALRPIVIDEEGVVLGGNMRLQALIALGHTDLPDKWVKKVKGWSEEQKREFVIKDNASYGEWDWDILANKWDDLPLSEWTIEVPSFDYSAMPEPKEEGQKKQSDGMMCPSCGYEIK